MQQELYGPNCLLLACKFHLAQAWFREIQNLGLASVYKNNSDVLGEWLQWVFGLTLLDPPDVGDGFCEWLLHMPGNDQAAVIFKTMGRVYQTLEPKKEKKKSSHQ
uniref:Uncharacterized protein n=1 Tax=Lygus hesperus TaxID=30085 RepID=A0A0A9YD35_LYGHE